MQLKNISQTKSETETTLTEEAFISLYIIEKS